MNLAAPTFGASPKVDTVSLRFGYYAPRVAAGLAALALVGAGLAIWRRAAKNRDVLR